jgi:crotonobetainyl-CoA:carnitine CoA-transferase CaiB-like acyl-CoA transferase
MGPLLAGVRVIDFGNYLAGPLSTMMLADLGADVIKVEPLTGDPMRGNESAFLGCQRGKRSLTLDLKHPGARPVIERLVANADIVHHNLRLPSADKFGLGYETLKAIKPDLIFGHVSAYGPLGPRRYWPGYDQLFQSSAGWELANAGEGNRPTWLRFGMMDHLCAMALTWGMLLALMKRDATGEGSQVAASLLGTSVLTMSALAMRPSGGLIGEDVKLDSDQRAISPGRRVARCSDGWIALVGPDEKAPSDADLASIDSDTAIAKLRGDGFEAVFVREEAGQDFLFDADKVGRGLVARYAHPIYGELRHPGAFWTMADVPLQLDRAPPTLGQHGTEILRELNFNDAEIDRLVSSGVVKL